MLARLFIAVTAVSAQSYRHSKHDKHQDSDSLGRVWDDEWAWQEAGFDMSELAVVETEERAGECGRVERVIVREFPWRNSSSGSVTRSRIASVGTSQPLHRLQTNNQKQQSISGWNE